MLSALPAFLFPKNEKYGLYLYLVWHNLLKPYMKKRDSLHDSSLSCFVTGFVRPATKFVPDGSYLLDEVKIHTDNKEIKPSDMRLYVRQNPNSKWFSTIKTQLYVYNWSGRDSTKWFNRFLRKIGDAPVIYNESDAIRSQEEIAKAVQNLGYMGASVKELQKRKKKKLKLFYEITSGKPYIVRTLKYDISDKKIAEYLRNDSTQSMLREGMLFDVNVLDAERQRITDYLLCNGYYKFNKDYITYTADTARNTHQVDLTFTLITL